MHLHAFPPLSRGPASLQPSRSTLSFCYAANFDKGPPSLLHYRRTDGTREALLGLPIPWDLFGEQVPAATSLFPFRSDYPSRLHPRLVQTSELLHLRSHCEAEGSPSTFGRLSLVILGRGFLKHRSAKCMFLAKNR